MKSEIYLWNEGMSCGFTTISESLYSHSLLIKNENKWNMIEKRELQIQKLTVKSEIRTLLVSLGSTDVERIIGLT